MIIAWVLSLLMLLSMLVIQLERLAVLEVISMNAELESQRAFIAAEKEILACENHLSNISALTNSTCHIQSAGKNLWLISSNIKPKLEILVFLDEKTNIATRIHWRQSFE